MSNRYSNQALRQQITGAAKAYTKVQWARRKGILPPPSVHVCVDCGAQAAVYDHRDYNKPLDVEPVCVPCNAQRGAALPANNDDPEVLFEKTGEGYCLSRHGIAAISFDAIDFFPVLPRGPRKIR
jgi:hypothetical protein